MHWKVYNIDTGKTIKAGFKGEEEAKDWLEQRHGLHQDKFMAEEMDHDEEEAWLEKNSDEDEEEVVEKEEVEAEEEESEGDATTDAADLSFDDDDDYLNPDEGILGEVYGDDDDE